MNYTTFAPPQNEDLSFFNKVTPHLEGIPSTELFMLLGTNGRCASDRPSPAAGPRSS